MHYEYKQIPLLEVNVRKLLHSSMVLWLIHAHLINCIQFYTEKSHKATMKVVIHFVLFKYKKLLQCVCHQKVVFEWYKIYLLYSLVPIKTRILFYDFSQTMDLRGPTGPCLLLPASLTLRTTLWAGPSTFAASAATGPPANTTGSTAVRAARASSRGQSGRS